MRNHSDLGASIGCGGCWSLGPDSSAIFSTQKDIATSFVSSQNGLGNVSKLARDSAVKSISCETLPNRTGWMMFANNPTGPATILSHSFLLKDWHARGFQRYFSIIVGHRERGHALRSLSNLHQKVEAVIEMLSKKCSQTYNQSHPEQSSNKDFLHDSRGKNRPLSNLSQLTGDPTLFLLLHKHFASLLRELETGRSDTPLSGQPIRSSVELYEARILLFMNIFLSFPAVESKVLLYCLLAGRALEISCPVRFAARQVADALITILPNNRRRDATYFANVILCTSGSDQFDYTLNVSSDCAGCVHDFSFDNKCCTCSVGNCSPTAAAQSKMDSGDGARKTTVSSNYCKDCSIASSSVAVGRLFNIIGSCGLNIGARHTKIVSFVEDIVNHSKIWAKLKSGQAKKMFLAKLGFALSDAKILNFFQMFLS